MSDHHHRRPAEGESHVSANRGALLATLVHLWPYIWPSDRRHLTQRVVWSLALLLAAMLAVRRLAYRTFVHMHELSLRFHLERKTGGLTRVLERGRNGIETIVRMVILQLMPTIVEVALLMGVLFWQFDWRYVLATLAMVVVFMSFTYYATEWRIGIRRKMNESDVDANTKA